jgi:alkylation response protein AidB-like acyl-CoA dehydrogenase
VSGFRRQRKQFGRRIGSFQALRHWLADLATEVEATRLLVYGVAAKLDTDHARCSRGIIAKALGLWGTATTFNEGGGFGARVALDRCYRSKSCA